MSLIPYDSMELFLFYVKDIEQYLTSIISSKNKRALKHYACNSFPVFSDTVILKTSIFPFYIVFFVFFFKFLLFHFLLFVSHRCFLSIN